MPKTIYQQAEDAQTSANTAKTTAQNNKTAWLAEKTRMINWLKINVGNNIDQNAMNHLRDTIIANAASARGVCVDYLQKTFDHLYSLTQDPTWQTSIADIVASQQHVDDVRNGTPSADNQYSSGS